MLWLGYLKHFQKRGDVLKGLLDFIGLSADQLRKTADAYAAYEEMRRI